MERRVSFFFGFETSYLRNLFFLVKFDCGFFPFTTKIGNLRLYESESEPATPSTSFPTHSAKTTKPITPLDVLSNDYADMTIGNSNSSMRNTGPMLSPKENIKKLKSSFFSCSKIDENKATINSTPASNVMPSSNNAQSNEGDYTIMNPVISKRIVEQQPQQEQTQKNHPTQAMFHSKKTALVTTANDPDKVLANTKIKTSIEGFKPITSRADHEVSQQNQSVPTTNTSFGRQHSAPVEQQRRPSDNGGYELLELRSSSSSHSMGGGRIPRPNSVNSEKTTFPPLNRPSSANSERQSHSTYSLSSIPLNEMGAHLVCLNLLTILKNRT